jgi:hypothetical protein
MNFDTQSVTFCEDARQELSGKYVLIGASAPDLTVSSTTISQDGNQVIPATLFVVGKPDQIGEFDATFQVVAPDKSVSIEGKFKASFIRKDSTSIIIGPLPVQLKTEGDYTFRWSFDDSYWEDLLVLTIRFANQDT